MTKNKKEDASAQAAAKPCAVLLLTHGKQGEALLESAAQLLGEWPPHAAAVALFGTERRQEIESRCLEALDALLQKGAGGALILSDLYGSTQANIAGKIAAARANVFCAHGINLAMTLEAVSLCHLPPAQLRKRAIAAGRGAITSKGNG